jgi:hypothetical protein
MQTASRSFVVFFHVKTGGLCRPGSLQYKAKQRRCRPLFAGGFSASGRAVAHHVHDAAGIQRAGLLLDLRQVLLLQVLGGAEQILEGVA